MPRLSEGRRRSREDGLVAAARDEFAEFGFVDASIGGIARRAGVSDGLLYRYFADKRAILAAVLERFMAAIVEAAEAEVFETADVASRLERLIGAQLSAFALQPAICKLFIQHLRERADYVGSPLQAQARRYTDLLIRIAREAKLTGEVASDLDERMLRDLVFGGIEHIAWRKITYDEDFDVPETARRLSRLVVMGVGGEGRA
jgi:AcrR family transcriptional regulator